jgi:hypothetical protein
VQLKAEIGSVAKKEDLLAISELVKAKADSAVVATKADLKAVSQLAEMIRFSSPQRPIGGALVCDQGRGLHAY